MARIIKSLTADETLDIISKQWADTNDIMKLGSVGRNKARQIIKEINESLESQGFHTLTLVPMYKVVEYFNINISYLRKMSSNAQK